MKEPTTPELSSGAAGEGSRSFSFSLWERVGLSAEAIQRGTVYRDTEGSRGKEWASKGEGTRNPFPCSVRGLPTRAERPDKLVAFKDPADLFMVLAVEAARQGIAVHAATKPPVLHSKTVPAYVGIGAGSRDVAQ